VAGGAGVLRGSCVRSWTHAPKSPAPRSRAHLHRPILAIHVYKVLVVAREARLPLLVDEHEELDHASDVSPGGRGGLLFFRYTSGCTPISIPCRRNTRTEKKTKNLGRAHSQRRRLAGILYAVEG
jgi:hypothetical protein